jgi:hypothetical protein
VTDRDRSVTPLRHNFRDSGLDMFCSADCQHRIRVRAFGRRDFLKLAGATVAGISGLNASVLRFASAPQTLMLSAPLELVGTWQLSPADAVRRVLLRMREVSLAGVRLVSDRQPDRLYVENHSSGPPAVWLHKDPKDVAWIIVDIGPRDWCKLAYQFGHELGHVLCNSWDARSKPRAPCQWLEETMVEAFSIRGLGRLAASWESDAPFAGDAAFGTKIREYRDNVINNYRHTSQGTSDVEIVSWFRAARSALENSALSGIEGPLIIRIVRELEDDIAFVEDMGALNRWTSRSGLPLEEYLTSWEKSCAEVHASGRLPTSLRTILDLS